MAARSTGPFRRAAQIIDSMQRDALLLARVHRELAAAIIAACGRAENVPASEVSVEGEGSVCQCCESSHDSHFRL